MAIMESAHSISSRESSYSVESEEEEEEQCGAEVFPLDSESDTEKEVAAPLWSRFPPRSGRADPPHLLFRGRKRHARKPLSSLLPERRQPVGSCCSSPETFCGRLRDSKTNFPRQAGSHKRTEHVGRKRPSNPLGVGRPDFCTAQPPVHGKKRQRSEVMEGQEATGAFSWTAGDRLFAQKCWELQGFVRPMTELLYRLKTGRFDQALSSFQQSVAMDRIQRIIGVLQKPEMGERYLGTLLQVERMLKVWFPRVTLKHSHHTDATVGATEEAQELAKKSRKVTTPGKRPVPDSAGSPPTEQLHRTHLADPDSPDGKTTPPPGEPGCSQGDWPAMNMTWIHTAPISNPPFGHMDVSQVSPAFGQGLLGGRAGGACGVIVFLQDNPAVPGGLSQGLLQTACRASQTCCHCNSTAWASSEHPRCQSLPSTAAEGSHLLKGTLDCLSRSLPDLPASLAEQQRQRASDKRLPHY